MKIERVSYAKLFNLGNYENERVELTAELDYDDGHLETLRALKDEVEGIGASHAAERGANRDASYKEYGAAARLERINADIVVAEVRWKKALELLQKHGLNTEDLTADDDIPF